MEKLFVVILIIAACFGIGAVMAAALQFVWNGAVAAAFNAPTLTFWQTWGCMVIVGFIGSCFKAATKSK